MVAATLAAEIALLSILILGLFELRGRFGLAPLFVFVGAIQYLQQTWSEGIYLNLWDRYPVSPGSIVLFTSSLFAILLIYLREDVPQARSLIWAVVTTNVLLVLLTLVVRWQLELTESIDILSRRPVPVVQGFSFLTGTLALVLDTLLVIVLYEALFKVKWMPPVGRIIGALVLVLYVDALIYVTLSFLGEPRFLEILAGNLVGKTFSGALYGVLLWAYLAYLAGRMPWTGLASSEAAPRGVFAILTYRERYEQVRREKEQQQRLLRAVVDGTSDTVFVKDLAGRYLMINPAGATALGRPAEEVLGKDDFQLLPSEIARPIVGADREVAAVGGPHTYEEVGPADGATRTYLTTRAPYRDESGKVMGVIGIAHDITDRAARRQAEEALRESGEFNRQVIASAREGIIVWDRDLRYLVWNPFMEELTALAASRVLGRHPSEVFPELWEQGTDVLLARALAGERVSIPDTAFSLPGGGRKGWFAGGYGPLRDGKGAIAGVIGVIVDMTERKRLEEQLLQAQKMEAVGRLAGGVAHDFNNLLSVIIGHTTLARKKLAAEDPLHRHSDQIMRAAERAGSLTRQLLAFSRKQVLQPKILDLGAVVTDMCRMLPRLIGEDIEVVTGSEPGLGRVRVDPGQIEQVIMNLIVNARDAMPRGGRLNVETTNVVLDEIAVAGRPEVAPGRYVQLAVSDTGEGMTPEVQARVFEPFFTTKELGKGTGLGLSTVFGIVKQSDGHIEIASAPGQGSSFRIYLPQVGEDPEAPAEGAAAASPVRGSETILLVEDEDALRELAREGLTLSGYNVIEASRGMAALEIARTHASPIHLMVTDVVMPGMNGRQLAEQVMPLRPSMKVLYISGHADEVLQHHGALDPGLEFIGKPFTPDALAAKVRAVLDGPKPQ